MTSMLVENETVELRSAPPAAERGVLRYLVQLAIFLALALFVNRGGNPVPSGNEWVYLLYFYKGWHPSFLSNDWTFQEPTAGHAVFNYSLGWMTRLMSLWAAAWVGRVCCWVLSFVAIIRLGRWYGISAWAVFAGMLLWMAQRQSIVTSDWMVGTFEAKCVGYICLFFALDAALAGRMVLAGILCGLTFSYHSAIGLWGGAALGIAVLTTQPLRETVRFAAAALVAALPGLITSISMELGHHAITAAEAKFLVEVDMPFNFDPFMFDKARLGMMALLLGFATVHAWLFRRSRAVGFLYRFELGIAAAFFFALVARKMEWFGLLKLFPMRVYAVLALLMFFWQLAATLGLYLEERPHGRLAVSLAALAGVLLLLAMPSPVEREIELARLRTAEWHRGDDDFVRCCRWVAANAPADAIVIAPPDRSESYYIMQRPLVANWQVPRYNAMTEWEQRIEALAGPMNRQPESQGQQNDMDPAAHAYFANLRVDQISDIVRRYGGNLLVTPGTYPYRPLFRAGSYTVYQLP